MQYSDAQTNNLLSEKIIKPEITRAVWVAVDILILLLIIRFILSLLRIGDDTVFHRISESIVVLFPVVPVVLGNITIDIPAIYAASVLYLSAWLVVNLINESKS